MSFRSVRRRFSTSSTLLPYYSLRHGIRHSCSTSHYLELPPNSRTSSLVVRVRREERAWSVVSAADFMSRRPVGRSPALVSPHMARRGKVWKCVGKKCTGDKTIRAAFLGHHGLRSARTSLRIAVPM